MPIVSEAPQEVETDQERRASPRLRLPAMLTHVQATPQRAQQSLGNLHGHAYDISETGMRIELDHALEVGERVDVVVELPWAGPHFNAEADVVWVNDVHDDPGPRRMAVRFDQAGMNGQALQLARFIEAGLLRAAA